MITDLREVYKQVKAANVRHRNNKRPFKKSWQVILHYSYFFFLVHRLIEIKDDDIDRNKSFELFCELCSLDMQYDFAAYEQFEKVLSKQLA